MRKYGLYCRHRQTGGACVAMGRRPIHFLHLYNMHKKTTEALAAMGELIRSGEYSATSFLPSERELSQRFRLSRGAMRVVCAALEEQGLLTRIPGKGLKVRSASERSMQHRLLVVLPSRTAHENEIMALLRGMVMEAEACNAEVVLFFHDADATPSRLIDRLRENEWSGLVLYEFCSPELAQALAAANCRFCIANSENASDSPAIRVDFRAVGRLAGAYLLKQGIRHVGFIGGTRSQFHYREMLAGLKGALAEEDIAPEKRLVFMLPDRNDPKNSARIARGIEAMRGKRLAFFAGRDYWARFVYEACDMLSLRIPKDVMVLGYDGLSWPEAPACGLTSILQPAMETGQLAVRAICESAERNEPPPPLTLVPPGPIEKRR